MTRLWGRGPAHRGARGTARGALLRAVVDEANRRCDGVLPTGLPGVREMFEDELALVGALQLRWHTRLAGAVEQALEADPGDPEAAVVAAWRHTARSLPGVRAVLDARAERPSSPREQEALRIAKGKDRALLAAMADLAAPGDPRAQAIGRRLEMRARGRLHVAA